jgi:hypothetical protein
MLVLPFLPGQEVTGFLQENGKNLIQQPHSALVKISQEGTDKALGMSSSLRLYQLSVPIGVSIIIGPQGQLTTLLDLRTKNA